MAQPPPPPQSYTEPPPAYTQQPLPGQKLPDQYDPNMPSASPAYPGSYQAGAAAGPVGPYYAGAAPGAYQGQYQPLPGQTPTYMQGPAVTVVQPQPQVIVVGGCPACRVGVLEDDFTCLGVCCAIVFFPIGLLCCLAMRQRRCPNCGAIFG